MSFYPVRYRSLSGGRLALLLPLAGCFALSDGPSSDRHEPFAEHVQHVSAEADAGGTSDFDVERYDLRGELDWKRHRLVATVGITFARKSEPLHSVTLDSAISEIKSVRAGDGTPLTFRVDAAHEKLQIDLPARPNALGRGNGIEIRIDYEATAAISAIEASSDSLFMIPALEGDPVPVRSAFTVSEPNGARRWLPCHDVPSDRAVFTVDMRMPANEKLIANGDLLSDEVDAGIRRMRYSSGFTLPTYLMSFALGDFVVERTMHGELPISVWHRRGLPGDYATMLRETTRATRVYERLFGPYPFNTYATVVVPGSWGMENATVSLLGEDIMDFSLNSGATTGPHELAHQWFGDLVTIQSWDDLWFKEGMAVLLEMDNLRPYLDGDIKGTLGGDRLTPRVGDAIRDPSRPPGGKGSGPYARAAWLLTQIRSLLGETAFWGTIRSVLHTYRYRAIGTDEFIDAFAPSLGSALTQRVRHAVGAKGLPNLEVMPSPSGGAMVTLHDPDRTLIAPVDVQWVSPDGSARSQRLDVDAPVTLAPRHPGEFLIVDPQDVHPDLALFAAQAGPDAAKNYSASVVPLMVPKAGLSRWLAAGGIHQFTLLSKSWPNVAPSEFGPFVKSLDAEPAQALAIQWGCDVGSRPDLDPETRAAWSAALTSALAEPPYTRGLAALGSKRYHACSAAVPVENVFAADWALLETGLPSGGMSEARANYLARFRLPPARAFSVWSRVVEHANSPAMRKLAAARLALDAPLVHGADQAIWREFFASLLTTSEVDRVLFSAISGVVITKGATPSENASSIAGLNAVLHNPQASWSGYAHFDAVCAAFTILEDPARWEAFVAGLDDAELAPDIRALLRDPTACGG